MIFNPHKYQERTIEFIKEHPYCAVFLDMGLGKTVSTLTALDQLMFEDVAIDKVLVIAPKSVALNTWSDESTKWDHTNHLRLSIIMGPAAKRRKALAADADLYVINRENVQWLVEELPQWPFDCVVIDESSSFKSHTSKRWKYLLKVRPQMRRLILLTGTPAPNGLMDLWAQFRLLDLGERLGKFISNYRETYFHPGAHSGAIVYEYVPNKGAKEAITDRISDISISMQASDYLEMPALLDGGMDLRMSDEESAAYKKFEQDCVMDLEDGAEIAAVTAVALTSKLLQFASGAVYDDEHEWHDIGSTKLEALKELLEQTNEPVLVYYNFKHEKSRILSSIKGSECFKGEPDILKRWNEGKIKVMLAHPASVAYGLNMQQGGHIIVWYSPTWNLELYQQANARLYRQGQTKPVILYHLTCKDTMDEAVMQSLRNKDNTQAALLRRIKELKDRTNDH